VLKNKFNAAHQSLLVKLSGGLGTRDRRVETIGTSGTIAVLTMTLNAFSAWF
jgi:hypothetical protein